MTYDCMLYAVSCRLSVGERFCFCRLLYLGQHNFDAALVPRSTEHSAVCRMFAISAAVACHFPILLHPQPQFGRVLHEHKDAQQRKSRENNKPNSLR